MLIDLSKRVNVWLRSLIDPAKAGPIRRDPPLAALLGETSWHGDHWANLLSSPMDARHYVLEDWSTPRPASAFET